MCCGVRVNRHSRRFGENPLRLSIPRKKPGRVLRTMKQGDGRAGTGGDVLSKVSRSTRLPDSKNLGTKPRAARGPTWSLVHWFIELLNP